MRHHESRQTANTRTLRPPPHNLARGRRRPWPLLAFLALLLCAGISRAAEAGCSAPTLTDLEKDPAFELKVRRGVFGYATDIYELDAGEYVYVRVGDPELVVLSEEWETRAEGTVRYCPSKKDSDTVTIEVTTSDSTGWQKTESFGLDLALFEVLTMKGVEASSTSGTHEIEEVTSVSKTIEAGWCYLIGYEGKLKLGDYQLKTTYKVKRRYAWWTKNFTTGHTVHAKGSVWVDCGTLTIVLKRRAALEIRFDYDDGKCPDPGCGPVTTPPPTDPPPPPPPPPPGGGPVTGGGEAPDDGDGIPEDDPEDPPSDPEDPADAEEGQDPETPPEDDGGEEVPPAEEPPADDSPGSGSESNEAEQNQSSSDDDMPTNNEPEGNENDGE